MKKTIKVVKYRRKREGRTDYKKRLKMLVSGISRLVVRRTNKHIIVQVVDYSDNGDKVVVTANSSELKKDGWKHATANIPAAYLTGMLAAQKAKKAGVEKAIVDLGLQPTLKGSRLYAAVKGAIDNGLEIPASEEIFPPADRLSGKHIAAYAKDGKFKHSPADIEKSFAEMKAKLSK
ncbi:MAG TPA: 50S ribosomal protein L18 [Alphaproteobacteria bacterium]|nr:50S ribosomal protein L18 [Alphaproteobacteria bacterium]